MFRGDKFSKYLRQRLKANRRAARAAERADRAEVVQNGSSDYYDKMQREWAAANEAQLILSTYISWKNAVRRARR